MIKISLFIILAQLISAQNLENANTSPIHILGTINKIRSGNEKLITVIGCGGDRDTKKRPKMAAIACNLSSQVIITSDNPRSENPEDILSA